MQAFYAILADVVVAVHLAYVSFVIIGQAAILLGLALGWKWVRNPYFRWTHLLMICVVAFEAIIRFECPLTTWEAALRRLAGQPVEAGTFVGRLLQSLMFPEWPEWVFLPVYVTFALIVLATFVFAPPRYRRGHTQQPQEATLASSR